MNAQTETTHSKINPHIQELSRGTGPRPAHHTRVKIVRQMVEEQASHPKPAASHDIFHRISQEVSVRAGSSTAFLLAVAAVILWLITGPAFHFSDTWQLVINTGTTIITFLMVFAIQNTQNRDAKAMQLKLNELIKGSRGARTEFVDIEDLTDGELDVLQVQFKEMHEKLQAKKVQQFEGEN